MFRLNVKIIMPLYNCFFVAVVLSLLLCFILRLRDVALVDFMLLLFVCLPDDSCCILMLI